MVVQCGMEHHHTHYKDTHRELLVHLTKTMDLARFFDREVPAQVLVTFFYIATHNGCRVSDLMTKLHLESSSASRISDWLSDYHRLGKPGMGLIVKQKDTMDLRVKRMYLTIKGQYVVDRIIEIFSTPVYKSTTSLFDNEEARTWLTTASQPGAKQSITASEPGTHGDMETELRQLRSTVGISPDCEEDPTRLPASIRLAYSKSVLNWRRRAKLIPPSTG